MSRRGVKVGGPNSGAIQYNTTASDIVLLPKLRVAYALKVHLQ